MIGAALYHRLLDRAVRVAKGEAVEDDVEPNIQLGEQHGLIPVEHVPDAVTRINLYARLSRMSHVEEIDSFEDELQDRFGALPPALALLLARCRLTALARAAGVTEVSAGPKGVAMTLPAGRDPVAAMKLAEGSELKGDRLVVPVGSELSDARLDLVERLLAALAA